MTNTQNDGYVHTFPAFVHSRFLVCKHLVQAVQCVVFPQSKKESYATFQGTSNPHPRNRSDNTSTTQIPSKHKDKAADIGEDDMADTMTGTGVNDSGAFRERFEGAIATIREFYKGLEYQMQFSGSAHAGYIGMQRCIVFAVGQRVSWEGGKDG